MPFNFNSLRGAFLGCCAILAVGAADAAGVQPDSTIVLLSADANQVQMGVKNTDASPLLMNVTVIDLPGSESVSVLPLPQVIRIEANGRQVVQFMFPKGAPTIDKQYLKRVSFEGIPPKNSRPEANVVTFTVRQVIPMVISPAGLVQDPEPWKRMQILRAGEGAMELRNDSPFVVRLGFVAQLMPMNTSVQLMKNSYVLPGEHIAFDLPKGVLASAVREVRINPASPWGFKVAAHDIAVRDTVAP